MNLPEVLGAEVHPAGSPVSQTTTGPDANAPPGAILFLSDPHRAAEGEEGAEGGGGLLLIINQ